MNSEEYQITIKSANQKVDDYVTSCKSVWTVHRLKQHISETHVNKPNFEDQRLIYAGGILKDEQTLKQIFFRDSLCTELTNSSKTDFTIHLVCSQNFQKSTSSSPVQRSQQQSSTPNLQSTLHHNPVMASTSVLANQANNYSSQRAETLGNQAINSVGHSAEQNVFSLNQQSAHSFNANHATEIARSLLQSDQIRIQFQQLANAVAAQIAANLVGSNQGGTESRGETGENPTQTQNSASSTIITHQFSNPTSPAASILTSANDEIAAAVAAAAIAGMQLSGDGAISTSAMTQSIYSAPTNNPFVAQTDTRESSNAGVAIHSGVNDRVGATNAQIDNNQLNPRPDVNEPQQLAAGANMGHQFNFGVNRQMAQAQPVVEQPAAAVAAPQVGDPEAQAMQHDVIDWVYYSIRAMIFFTALYIHASLTRLSFLAGVLAIYYYFNRRSARRAAQQQQQRALVRDNQMNPAQGVANANAQDANVNAHLVQAARIEVGFELRRRRNLAGAENDQNQENGNANEIGGNQRQDIQVSDVAGQRRVSFLKLCYLVVTDFLASLVPE